MRRKSLAVFALTVAACLMVFAGGAYAYIMNGDFEDGVNVNNTSLVGDSGTYGQWLGRGNATSGWQIVDDGLGVDGAYARHLDEASILFQGCEWDSSLNGWYTIGFDFIYEEVYNVSASAKVFVVGLTGSETINTWDIGKFEGTPAYNVLYSADIATRPDWQPDWDYFLSDPFQINGSYDALAVVFYANSYISGTDPSPGLRGVDNVSCKPVPEPSTVILLGAGLLGLVAVGRKKFKK